MLSDSGRAPSLLVDNIQAAMNMAGGTDSASIGFVGVFCFQCQCLAHSLDAEQGEDRDQRNRNGGGNFRRDDREKVFSSLGEVLLKLRAVIGDGDNRQAFDCFL